MPEENKVLYTATAGERNVWVKGFLTAIAGCVRNCAGGSSLPPVTRSVKYEFTKGEHRGAVYMGSMTQVRGCWGLEWVRKGVMG